MKRISLIFCICIVSQVVVAQCKLTVTVSFSGNCTGSLDARLQKAVAEQTAKHYNGMTFSIPEDCERAGLAARNNISGSYGGCTAHVTILCGGCSRVSKAGSVDVLGVSKGTSFYSINGANEIRDWSNDDMERMLALNKEHQSFAPTNISTGDTDFDNARNEYNFTGYMPEGSVSLIKKEDIFATDGSIGARTGIVIPDEYFNGKKFVPINMREGGSSKIHSEDFDMIDVGNLKPISLKANEEKDIIDDFWFDLAGDVAKTAKDIFDISKVLATGAATATAATAIGTAILADFTINLIVEDAKAYYKVYKGEYVTTGDIFKNTLEKSSMGLFKVENNASGYFKGGVGTVTKGASEHYVKEGTLTFLGASQNVKGLAGPGVSIANRTAKYAEMILNKDKETE